MSGSALNCEVLTDYGWGYVRDMDSQYDPENGRIVIDLEGFQGWDSRKVPTLYSYAGEMMFRARSQGKLGSCVKTTRGFGVLIDTKGEDEHIVRSFHPWGVGEKSSMEGLVEYADDILGTVENFNWLSQEMDGSTTIEARNAVMLDLDSGLLNQHFFEFFVTILMQVTSASDFFPGLVEAGRHHRLGKHYECLRGSPIKLRQLGYRG